MPVHVPLVLVSAASCVCPMDASAASSTPFRLPRLPICSRGFRLTQTLSISLPLGSLQPKLPFCGVCSKCWVRAICLSTVSSALTTVPQNPPAGRPCPWLAACAPCFALSSFCNGVSISQYTWIAFLAFSTLSLTASVVAQLRLLWASPTTKYLTLSGHRFQQLHRFIIFLKRLPCLPFCELFPWPELKRYVAGSPVGRALLNTLGLTTSHILPVSRRLADCVF